MGRHRRDGGDQGGGGDRQHHQRQQAVRLVRPGERDQPERRQPAQPSQGVDAVTDHPHDQTGTERRDRRPSGCAAAREDLGRQRAGGGEEHPGQRESRPV
jgi:hypothetical protein